MLEILSIGAIILGVVVAGILAYASTRPDTFAMSRSVSIKAPPEKIFPHIDNLHSFNRWNPFLKKDTATKLVYSGPDSGKGAAHAWEGNSHVGKGRVEITESSPPSKVVMRLDTIRPMQGHNRVEFTLEPGGETTTVAWTMQGRQPFMAKVATIFIDCESMVGREFEKGLADLKIIAEA
jgi:uncharacterized protein YndB with AHSA1/START domain